MNENPSQFFLLLHQHRRLGVVFSGCLVEEHDELSPYVVPFIIDSNSQYMDTVDASALEILRLADSCTDAELSRHFSRNKKATEFIRDLDDTMFKQHVRPFIDQQINKAIQTALASSLRICYREEREEGGRGIMLHPQYDQASPRFHFTRTIDGLLYRLEVFHNETRLALQDRQTKIISYVPCWLKVNQNLIQLPEGFDGLKLTPFLTKTSISVPKKTEKEYLEKFVLKNVRTGEVQAEGFEIKDKPVKPITELSLETDWQGQGVLVIWFRYGEKRIMAGKAQMSFVDMVYQQDHLEFTRIRRNAAWESEQIELLTSIGLVRKNENLLGLPTDLISDNDSLYSLVEWINRNSDYAQELGIQIIQPQGVRKYITGSVSININIDNGFDWFDIFGTVKFGSFEFPFLKLRPYILNDTREFPLPDGLFAILPLEWFSRYRDILAFGTEKDNHIRVIRHHYPLVQEMKGANYHSTNKITDHLSFQNADPARISADLKASLRPYQEEGLQWLQFQQKVGFGSCLADDMGLGKTLQTLALLLSIEENKHPASLIVMPASLIHNWRSEIRRFAPTLRSLIHIGPDRHGSPGMFDAFDLVLTTYGTLRRDIQWLSKYGFLYVILDESQVIKNPDAKTTGAVFELQADHRLTLTGTPIQNSLSDLWSQMNFLNPGLLGTHTWFLHEFEGKNRDIPDELQTTRLKKLVAPFILRRKKEDVEPDLPPLIQNNWYCEMTDAQRKMYESEKSAVRNFILDTSKKAGTGNTSIQVLRALIRLRQISNHPQLVDPDFEGESGKVEEVLRNLETLVEEHHKVLVFSSFVKYLNYFATEFEKRGWKYSMLTGATRDREQVVRNFRTNPEKSIFLISLKAGGEGLNLVEASYVYLLDPWWNPAAEQQAMARAHRIGQQQKVIAYNYITKDSVEEKILLLQEKKAKLSETFIQTGNPLKDFSSEETIWLFE